MQNSTTTCTNTYSEVFTTDNIPETCQGHGTQKICTESGKEANAYCPEDKVKTVSYGGVIPKEQLKLWNTLKKSKVSSERIDEVCTIHKKTEEKKDEKKNEIKNEVVKEDKNKKTTDKKETTKK